MKYNYKYLFYILIFIANSSQAMQIQSIGAKTSDALASDLILTDKLIVDYKKFFRAVKDADLDGVKKFIDAGAKVNKADNSSMTALHYATNYGYRKMVRLLLNLGAKVNKTNCNNEAPLHIAASKGYKKITQLLLNAGANVDIADNSLGDTPLLLATQRGQREIVELLLRAGATVDKASKYNLTALDIAANCGYETIVVLLVDHMATITQEIINGAKYVRIAEYLKLKKIAK